MDCQPHLFPKSLKKWNSKFSFDPADLNRDVRLHAVRFLSCAREAQFMRQDAKDLKLSYFHEGYYIHDCDEWNA